MNNTGWVKLHRKLFDNKLWVSEPFTKGQAWVDLFANANHYDSGFWVRGNYVAINRGQIGWSELTMAKRWGWSKNKVRRFLKLLETEHQTIQQKTPITSIITILNYELYQSDVPETEHQTIQQKDSRRYTNKNDKNEKNEKNIVETAVSDDKKYDSVDLELSRFLVTSIKAHMPTFKEPNIPSWASHVRLMRERDNRSPEQIKFVIEWCQNNSFWSPNILSTKKLREKFDTLVGQMKREFEGERIKRDQIAFV